MTTSEAMTRQSFKTILFATDFSPASEAALPYVSGLGHNYDSRVIVAHAVPIEPMVGITLVPPPAEMDLEWQDAQRAMQKYADSNAFADLRHEFVLERGNLPAVVSDLTAHEPVDLIVLGTHGRQGLRKVFAGSMAEQIFREAKCPVLTVGPGVHAALRINWKPNVILLATDFSAGSVHALPYALSLAEANMAKLILLHVVPLVPWEQQAQLGSSYQKRLEELLPPDATENLVVDFAVRFDLPVPAILDVAKQKMADLIVLGVHHTRMPALESHAPWATAYDVISGAHCPVLTLRG